MSKQRFRTHLLPACPSFERRDLSAVSSLATGTGVQDATLKEDLRKLRAKFVVGFAKWSVCQL
jgi:hypothetical protein